MNTIQITKALKCNTATRKLFKGIFTLDQIPKNISKPAILVINTDTSAEKGTHWLAIFVPVQECAEYFDSFVNPPFHSEIVNFNQNVLFSTINVYKAIVHQFAVNIVAYIYGCDVTAKV